jgi:hypothetical protein
MDHLDDEPLPPSIGTQAEVAALLATESRYRLVRAARWILIFAALVVCLVGFFTPFVATVSPESSRKIYTELSVLEILWLWAVTSFKTFLLLLSAQLLELALEVVGHLRGLVAAR